ncbi:MAG TPA: hypothetical protein HA257_01775 [Candidatus Methanoperedenaceae archaeon]|nr:hypothetical protein [Candidatus Methanoperedenaceae archaeon]
MAEALGIENLLSYQVLADNWLLVAVIAIAIILISATGVYAHRLSRTVNTSKEVLQDKRAGLDSRAAQYIADLTASVENLAAMNKNLRLEIMKHRLQAELSNKSASEMMEVFRALPYLYCRLLFDGTILEYNVGKEFDMYLPPTVLNGVRITEILPSDISIQLQDALLQVYRTKSMMTLEYNLNTLSGEHRFEVKLLPSTDDQIIGVAKKIQSVVRQVDDPQKAKSASLVA